MDGVGDCLVFVECLRARARRLASSARIVSGSLFEYVLSSDMKRSVE